MKASHLSLQYVGLAQGIQGTFVAASAIPGRLHDVCQLFANNKYHCLHSAENAFGLQLAGWQIELGVTQSSDIVQLRHVVSVAARTWLSKLVLRFANQFCAQT